MPAGVGEAASLAVVDRTAVLYPQVSAGRDQFAVDEKRGPDGHTALGKTGTRLGESRGEKGGVIGVENRHAYDAGALPRRARSCERASPSRDSASSSVRRSFT